jgi:hypothetical protein
MKLSTTKLFGLAALTIAILMAIYIGIYLLTIQRSSALSYGPDPTSPTYCYYSVQADFRGGAIIQRLDIPLLSIDRRFIRRRYWEGWYIVDGTNTVFEGDMSRYKANHHK